MSKFTNVSVVKKANIYFDGKVTSRAVHFEDGSVKTLGIMLPGEYEFGTEAKELMEIQAGTLKIKLEGGEWFSVTGGDSFEVPANSSFKLVVEEVADYCCSYL